MGGDGHDGTGWPEDRDTNSAGSGDVQKFLITTVAASFFMLGFSYTNSYFRTFGLGILDLNLSVTDVIARGVVLLETWEAVLAFCFIASIAAISQHPWILKRNWLHSAIFLFGFLVSATITNAIGSAVGKENAINVASAKSGKRTFCKLHKNAEFSTKFRESFDSLTREKRISKIFENEKAIYLSYGIWNNNTGEQFGRTFAIPRSSIAYCNLVGD